MAWALLVPSVGVVGGLGCSSAGDVEAATGLASGGSYDPSNGDSWGSGTGSAEDGDGSGGDGVDSTGDPTAADTDGAERPGDDEGIFAPCPQPLPGSWVFCEDFESITDPAEVMLDYQDRNGAFVLVDGVGASGDHAMEASYREGEEGAGWMVLSFGASPLATLELPAHAPEGSFQEIYWRLRVKTEPGWPDEGPGQLTRTVAFASDDWSEAVVAHLRSPGQDVTLEGVPVTCVDGSAVACSGYDDQAGLESLGAMVGDAPLFSEAMSGQWQCVEGHLRLNTPGQADGVFEFWVNDEIQATRSDLDLRGSWTGYGINALVVENLWPGGAPAELRRWIDDLVVSTEPIGCGPGPFGVEGG